MGGLVLRPWTIPLNLIRFHLDSYERRRQEIFPPFKQICCGAQKLTSLESAGEVVFIRAAFEEASQRGTTSVATRADLKHSPPRTVHIHFSPTSYTSDATAFGKGLEKELRIGFVPLTLECRIWKQECIDEVYTALCVVYSRPRCLGSRYESYCVDLGIN